MLLSIIIPCYNEELVIEETYKRLKSVMDTISYDHELIFINDGSADNTYLILAGMAEADARVKVINFSRNFGHQNAVTAGMNYCTGDAAVIIDSDLQDPPEVIPDMLAMMEKENASVVYAVRKKRVGESKFKLLTAKYFYRILNKMSDVKFPVDTGDFRLVDRQIIDNFNKLTESNKYIRGLISWMGFKQVPFYYARDKRFAGETKYPLKKMIRFATIGLFYFSKKPLQIATVTGFTAVILGFVYALVTLFVKLFTDAQFTTGWTSTIFLIIFFGGIQLLTIGVLGQYVGNLFDEAKGRPDYIVKDKMNF